MGTEEFRIRELEEELRQFKKAYSELVEGEKKYKVIFETSQDAIGISKDGVNVFVNDAYVHLFGYQDKQEMIGKSILEQIAPAEHERVKAYFLTRGKGEDVPNFYETTGIRKNGEEFPFDLNLGFYAEGADQYNVLIIRDITQQKRAEEELLETNERFSAAFYQSSIGQLITSLPDGLIYDVNEALLNLTGYKHNDFVGKTSLELDLWAVAADRDSFLKEISQKRAIQNREFRFRYQSGELRDCLISANIIKMKGKEYVLTNLIDITKRKQIEEKLKESEMRWHFSVDGSGLGLWDWNAITNKVFFSPQWKKILGFEEHEIEGSLAEWENRVHPEDLENVHTDLNAHFEGKTPIYSNEHRVLSKDGTYKWILDRGKVISWTKEGKPARVIGTHTDIDTQKRNQQVFIESIAKFRLLFEQSPLGIYIANAEGQIIDGNRQLLELLGSPSIQATKEINVMKFPPLIQNGYAAAFRKCLETKEKQQIEMVYTSVWGKQSYLSSYIVPLLNPNGDVQHVYTLMEDISERKEFERELRESRQRLELFFTQSAIGFFFMMLDEPLAWDESDDKDKMLDHVFRHQRITKVNDAMLKQYGFRREDFIGLTPMDFYRQKPEERKKLWRRLFDEGKLHIDTEEIRSDGSSIILTGDYICLYDEQNRILGHFGALSDVTAEREAQLALKVSEEKFKNIIESANDWIWEVDASGHYTYASPKVSKILGYSAEEIIGKTPFDLMPEEEAGRLRKVYQEITRNKKTINSLENVNRHKDGQDVILETSGTPFYDSKGNILGYRGIDRDITKKKKAVEALRESEELLRAAQKIARMGHWNFDQVHNVITWSDQTYTIFGLNPKEFHPTFDRYFELIHPEDREKVKNAFAEALEKKEKFHIIHRIVLPDGQIRYVSENGNTRFDEHGKPLISIGTVQDITRERILQAELEKKNHELEELVATKDKLFSIIAHDLKGPLSSMMAFIDLLAEEGTPAVRDVSKILRSQQELTRNIYDLLDNLLNWARHNMHQIQIKKEVLKINEVLNECLDSVSMLSRRKSITQFREYAGDYLVIADRDIIRLIIRNLMTNAIKFTPEKGSISISTEETSEEILICIRDTGVGISDENIVKILSDSEFLTTYGTNYEQGSGLGLKLVKDFILASGGSFSIDSKVHEYTSVSVGLPKG
ncbi:MAG: PAS domain S-box protein [Bacteroidales bacterium]|nr:PAS domain S-box protein [Bacteroidales bacterium]